MKKFIIILSVMGIALLTLNSCATTACKGGSCPAWSDVDTQLNSQHFQNFKFIEEIEALSSSTMSFDEDVFL